MIRQLLTISFLLMLGLALAPAAPSSAATGEGCNIPRGGDQDGNGIGDEGVQVVCNYTALYAEDASGAYYWDLGDGRIYTTDGISSPDDLDQDTLTTCYYQIHTKGTFENDPFQDSGVISNMIRCSGYAGTSTYNYQIVHKTDPRYRGNPDMAVWGDWEYHVYTISGQGNIARPAGPVA